MILNWTQLFIYFLNKKEDKSFSFLTRLSSSVWKKNCPVHLLVSSLFSFSFSTNSHYQLAINHIMVENEHQIHPFLHPNLGFKSAKWKKLKFCRFESQIRDSNLQNEKNWNFVWNLSSILLVRCFSRIPHKLKRTGSQKYREPVRTNQFAVPC